MIGAATGHPVSITGLGAAVPERVVTNDEIAETVDTSDEWIVARTGIRERRVAAPEQALSDVCLPAARDALSQAGLSGDDIDLLIVATVTPDMVFPATAALLADALGAHRAGAYDLSAGCTGFVYAVAQAHAMVAGGLCTRALVVGGDLLSKVVDWTDRGTCVLFGDGGGAVVVERVESGGFLGFELGADGSGGMELYLPAGGSRRPPTSETVAAGEHFARMNGREVFRFATRVLVSSANELLAEVGLTVGDVDAYVPHQANIRIIRHAAEKLGIPEEKVVVNVDRYGNTSSGSIPLALADGVRAGIIGEGKIVLMTGMGAGLTWGSAVMEWTSMRDVEEIAA
jgi:3-oxoacyl-[acyl-carrier-protein] synthase III